MGSNPQRKWHRRWQIVNIGGRIEGHYYSLNPQIAENSKQSQANRVENPVGHKLTGIGYGVNRSTYQKINRF